MTETETIASVLRVVVTQGVTIILIFILRPGVASGISPSVPPIISQLYL